MKYLQFAAIVFGLYFFGYVLGPTITEMIVSEKEPEGKLVRKVKVGEATYEIDLEQYGEGQLPAKVELQKAVAIATADGEGTVRLSKGDTVKVLNRKGDVLLVESEDGAGNGEIAPSLTNIYEVLAKKKVDDLVAKRGGGNPTNVPVVAKIPATQPTPQPTPPAPSPVAVNNPTPTPQPMPAVDPPAPDVPVVANTEAPSAGGSKLSDDEIVALMKKSIAGGAVKEFTIDKVKDNGWKANGDETIDGTDYQTGLVAYVAATIFGDRPVQAKALIKDGKIERWVYAKSGMEIQ